MPRGELWQESDDTFLLEHYSATSPVWCAEKLGRTREAVVYRMHLLRQRDEERLTRRAHNVAARKAVDALEELYLAGVQNKVIAAVLDKPLSWVSNRVMRLGLAKVRDEIMLDKAREITAKYGLGEVKDG